ncbi:type IV pilus biogenesis/stability protein PilW [Vibrio sp. SS-MA-C1-2]|uniref:type IV pilus biogenesis/stability protein PilW n=1 Tax=Vibrio sp. SS-MA-C1-2 TaxID=2908646 RepID=UPI001F18B711|nr:type IV pilus biogenesis/stability protein PilW [Vibrio sp. SS-MA-C1-2]UJF18960.1 type IV pilus biogenesis/stability protein PilW [Vibrio sp. SS-MA-C1-2]
MLGQFTYWFFFILLAGCSTINAPATDNLKLRDAADARIDLGLGYLTTAQPQSAEKNLRLALEYQPKYSRAVAAMAYYYSYIGEVELAWQQYQQALTLKPLSGKIFNNYGVFLCQQQAFTEAMIYFEKAVLDERYQNKAESLENAGVCSLKAGNMASATHFFQRALRREPHLVVAKKQLALIEQ